MIRNVQVIGVIEGNTGRSTEFRTGGHPAIASGRELDPLTDLWLNNADVEELTYTTTFMIMQSLRLDYGVGSQVHP